MGESVFEVMAGRSEKVMTRRGEVLIREITLEDTVALTGTFITMFSEIDPSELGSMSSIALSMKMLSSGVFVSSLKSTIAIVTDKPVEFYDKLPIVDLLKVVQAFLRVNPVKELRDLFFDIRDLVQEKRSEAVVRNDSKKSGQTAR